MVLQDLSGAWQPQESGRSDGWDLRRVAQVSLAARRFWWISCMMFAMNVGKRVRQAAAIGRVIRAAPHETANVLRLVRTRGRSTLDVRLPWLPFAVIDFLAEEVGRESRIFEYGGGGSTAWFADRAGQVVTVEHDEAWYRTLVQAIECFRQR